MWKKTLLLIISLITVACIRQPKGFHPHAISSPLKFSPQWSVDCPECSSMLPILSQDFFYLASGAQCFAFVSADGKYVLKFFKMKHLLPKKWLYYFPFPFLKNYRFRKTKRRSVRQHALFSSYALAWEHLRKETGLVYLHLNKTNYLNAKPCIFNKEGKRFQLSLDHYEFVLQRKSTLVKEQIAAYMQTGDQDRAAQALQALLRQVALLSAKGFIDCDSGVSHNFGFVDDQVIHFDVGQLATDPLVPTHRQHEVSRVAYKLKLWLKEAYPELLPYVEGAQIEKHSPIE